MNVYSVSITYQSEDLEVFGDFIPGSRGSMSEPGSDPYCEATAILYKNIDILPILTSKQVEEIEELAVDALYKRRF